MEERIRFKRKGFFILVVVLLISISMYLSSVASSESKITGENSDITIPTDKFIRWSYEITGNESVLYKVKSLTKNEICIMPKSSSLNDIVQEEDDLSKEIIKEDKKDLGEVTKEKGKEIDESGGSELIESNGVESQEKTYEKKLVTYKYPKGITLYKGQNKEVVSKKDLSKDKKSDRSLCFPIDYKESKYYKLGENSITIIAEMGYNSTDINISQEDQFAHIEISDPNIILYLPFDVIHNSTNKTWDYSSSNNDGTVYHGDNGVIFNSTGGVYGGSYNFIENMSSIANMDPSGVTQNGTYIWASDYMDLKVYQYYMNGTYTGEYFDTSVSGYNLSGANRGLEGITQNGTFFWIVHYGSAEVEIFYMNGTYTGNHWDTSSPSGNGNPRGITTDNNFIWINDDVDDKVYKYYMNGTYTGDSFSISSNGNIDSKGITQNGTFFWITDNIKDQVYKYYMNGTFIENFSIVSSNNGDSKGITQNNTFFWIADALDTQIYKYYINGSYMGSGNRINTLINGRPPAYISTNKPLSNATTSWTFSLLINPKTTSHTDSTHIMNLFGNYDGWVRSNNNGGCSYNIRNGSDQGLTAGNTCPLGTWTNLIGTRENSNFSIYTNGTLRQSRLISGTIIGENAINRIGSYVNGYTWIDYVNLRALLDEIMVLNKTLNTEEVKQINNGTYERFYIHGEMLFQNLNFFENSKVNISLQSCQTYEGTYIDAKINDGDYVNFTNCNITDYNITGDLANADLTIRLNSNQYGFYSPVVMGNITLDDYQDIVPPSFNITYPPEGLTINNIVESYTMNVTYFMGNTNLDSCWYNISGAKTVGNTIIPCSNGTNSFTITFTEFGLMHLYVSANDTFNNINNKMVNLSILEYTGPGSGGGQNILPSGNYSVSLTTSQRDILCSRISISITKYSTNLSSYSSTEIYSLKNDLAISLGMGVSNSVLKYYIDNFNKECPNYVTIIPEEVPEEKEKPANYTAIFIIIFIILSVIGFIILYRFVLHSVNLSKMEVKKEKEKNENK